MLNLSMFTDSVTALLSDGTAQQIVSNNDMLAAITASGFSLQDLQGLDSDRLIGLLNSQGIDVSALAPEQLQSLIDAVSAGRVSDLWNRS